MNMNMNMCVCTRQVRKLMLKHERELRLGIRRILVQHGEGCDQPTPLEAPLYRCAWWSGSSSK